MFEILQKSFKAGVVTTGYPQTPAEVSSAARGRPQIDFVNWKDARPATKICPTGAIDCRDQDGERMVTFDLGKCIFCGLCADVDPAILMTSECELAACKKSELTTFVKYKLNADGTHRA